MADIVEGGEIAVEARTVRRAVLMAVLAALLGVAGVVPAPAAEAAPRWIPLGSASIHPGVQVHSPRGQCTANFVFLRGEEVYLGTAAHCAGTGGSSDANGCRVGSLPLGTPFRIAGASRPGTLAYSSWLAMGAAKESDPATCRFNDFALIRIDPADRERVNPTVPVWGGPHGVGRDDTVLQSVYSLGNSSLRQGISVLQPKPAISIGRAFGWTHGVYQLLPGIPGDSGGPALDARGNAVGLLSTLVLAPLVGSNQLTDIGRAMAYAQDHGMNGLTLAHGTEGFRPGRALLG